MIFDLYVQISYVIGLLLHPCTLGLFAAIVFMCNTYYSKKYKVLKKEILDDIRLTSKTHKPLIVFDDTTVDAHYAQILLSEHYPDINPPPPNSTYDSYIICSQSFGLSGDNSSNIMNKIKNTNDNHNILVLLGVCLSANNVVELCEISSFKKVFIIVNTPIKAEEVKKNHRVSELIKNGQLVFVCPSEKMPHQSLSLTMWNYIEFETSITPASKADAVPFIVRYINDQVCNERTLPGSYHFNMYLTKYIYMWWEWGNNNANEYMINDANTVIAKINDIIACDGGDLEVGTFEEYCGSSSHLDKDIKIFTNAISEAICVTNVIHSIKSITFNKRTCQFKLWTTNEDCTISLTISMSALHMESTLHNFIETERHDKTHHVYVVAAYILDINMWKMLICNNPRATMTTDKAAEIVAYLNGENGVCYVGQIPYVWMNMSKCCK
jgi:hypothetical protein